MDIIKTIIKNRLTKDEFYNWYKNNYKSVINVTYDNIFNYISNLPDIEIAVKELIYAMLTNKLIILCVDIDHDGCASGTIGYKMLTTLFPNTNPRVKLVISSRKYKRGFNIDMLTKIDNIVSKEELELGLIITADMGTTDNENYGILKQKYKDVKIIVTDHHTVDYNNYPNNADALINVHRDDFYFEKCICGCATLFFLLVETYFKYYKIKDKNLEIFQDYLPYVAAATIVDSMSMKYPINRYLVNIGIKHLNLSPDRNFITMKKVLGLPPDINYKDIAMSIGPLINTGNRLSFEQLTLYSLTTEDDKKSVELMLKLHELNKIRKHMSDSVLQTTLRMNNIWEYKYVAVVRTITKINIAGIVAGSIMGMTNTPCICFIDRGSDVIAGSARSISGVNFLSVVRGLKDLVLEANGHEGAFGVSIRRRDLEEFKMELNIALAPILQALPKSKLKAELILTHDDINFNTIKAIDSLAPYGLEWKAPICSSKESFIVKDIIPIRNFFKLTLLLYDGTEVIAFHFFRELGNSEITLDNFTDIIKKGMRVKAYFYLYRSFFKGEYSVGMEIIDIYPSYKD